jgi:uncharacterized protein involved in exopolysaccharide biosynthesis
LALNNHIYLILFIFAHTFKMTDNTNNNKIRFDLIEIINIGLKWKKAIIGFALLISVLVAIYMLFQKNVYNSSAVFYPASSVIASRDNIFRTEIQDAIDMIGQENEVDRIMAIGNSAPVLSDLITKFEMAKHYKIDVKKDPKGYEKVYKRFSKAFNVRKGAYNNLELNMKDHDDVLASKIANDALLAIQENIRSYYAKSSTGVAEALEIQMKMQDSVIQVLTENLIVVREKYGIYNILSPSRKVDGNVSISNARGLEEVQNLEELKDKYVMDRAKYESIRNEFKTSKIKTIPFLHVIQYPTSAGPKVGPYRTLNVIGAGAFAAFLALIVAVIIEYFESLKHLFKPYNAKA